MIVTENCTIFLHENCSLVLSNICSKLFVHFEFQDNSFEFQPDFTCHMIKLLKIHFIIKTPQPFIVFTGSNTDRDEI